MGDNLSGFGSWLQGIFGGSQQATQQPTQQTAAPQQPMDWQKMGQFGTQLMNQGAQTNNQMAQQAAHMNMVGQGSGQGTQMLQSLMQPTQMMNQSLHNQMNPQNVVQSLLNPSSSMTASQVQGLLH